jgi:hypothetical protein
MAPVLRAEVSGVGAGKVDGTGTGTVNWVSVTVRLSDSPDGFVTGIDSVSKPLSEEGPDSVPDPDPLPDPDTLSDPDALSDSPPVTVPVSVSVCQSVSDSGSVGDSVSLCAVSDPDDGIAIDACSK